MDFSPKIVNRADTKPIYIIVAIDPTVKGNIQYYKSQNVLETPNCVEIKGWLLTKTQADFFIKEPFSTEEAKMGIEVNRKIPWHNVVTINNVTYKQTKTAE